MTNTTLLKDLGKVKLQIIQGIANLDEDGNKDDLLIMYGYVECLKEKSFKKKGA